MRPETPEDRRAHETACLEEVERQAYADETLKRDKTIIHRVWLDGEYPDTRICVDIERFSRRRVLEWRLWDEGNGDFGDPPPDGSPAPPKIIAMEVMIELMEF